MCHRTGLSFDMDDGFFFPLLAHASQIEKKWSSDSRFGETLGPIAVIASDGDPVRRGDLYHHAAAVPAEGGKLPLADHTTSVFRSVHGFDMKHNCKRERARDSTEMGSQISKGGLSLNRNTLAALFRVHDGNPEATYDTLFDPKDK